MKTPDEFRKPTVQNRQVKAPKTTINARGLWLLVVV